MKKVTFKDYERAVREARQYVNRYDKVRWKIAEIAVSVCDCSLGGRKIASVFSLKKFAEDIELNPKTLYQWIRVKKFVYDKLPAINLKQNKFNYQDLSDVTDRVELDTPAKTVARYFAEQLEIPPENKKFLKYKRSVKSLLFNAQRPMSMLNVDKKIIEDLITYLDTISALLKTELKLREKFSAQDRMTDSMNKRKKEIEKISDQLDDLA